MKDIKAKIGMIGLGVMGQNLVLNMSDNGLIVAVYDRNPEVVDTFLRNSGQGREIIGAKSLEELVTLLEGPRKIMLMIKAGSPVDTVISSLKTLLDEEDIIIDGGNSHFSDSTRRMNSLAEQGILFVGMGISGGEIGARRGPSIMPGGAIKAWPAIRDIYRSIAAKGADGTICCEWLGTEGSGHFVKMVHNGIEYGDMQLICEAYDLMKTGLGMQNKDMSTIFAEWNKGKLNSYLIEITADILAYQDEKGEYVVDAILDTAGQKGTGKWAGAAALDTNSPLTLIGEAVFARFLSALKVERGDAALALGGTNMKYEGDQETFILAIHDTLYASKIISYAQGYMLLKAAALEHGWTLDYGTIASLWREGCIIRASFLDKIKAAFDANPVLGNLLLDDYFKNEIINAESAWRKVVAAAVELTIPLPAMSSALAFYDGYRRERLPANLLQAQRDYFGAHTYERLDKPRGEFFHTNWTGDGGDTTSTPYEA
ncbi:decarboxylating NADP(+)-dependent phosphogluconate dehydrogenase [Spirochaetota bacterium]